MYKIIIMSGYAVSGKSVAISYLEANGIQSVSTSRMLHNAVEAAFKQIFKVKVDTHNKKVPVFIRARIGSQLLSTETNWREIMISYIESAITHIFGRAAVGAAAAKEMILKSHTENTQVVYEAFNLEEAEGFLDYLALNEVPYEAVILVVKGDREKPELDGREIIESDFYSRVTIVNDYTDNFFTLLEDTVFNIMGFKK